jgi:hypothetical protein
MPITSYDQINLLYDILSNHQTDCSGSMSECQQIQRLVQSLVNDTSIPTDVKTTLKDIYDYSHLPQSTQQLEHHIQSHDNHLTNWISSIETFTNRQ